MLEEGPSEVGGAREIVDSGDPDRPWQFTRSGMRHLRNPLPGLDFTLMSYNILSDRLLFDNRYLYGHCPPRVLKWNFRKNNLLSEIVQANPDIVCLQEMEEVHYFELFKPTLVSLGYQASFKRRTGKKSDGCALFVRRSKFVIEQIVPVEYFRKGIPILNRDNVGLIAVLRPEGSTFADDSRLCVATTHLLFNPKRGDIRLTQAMLLLAELDRLAFKSYDPLNHHRPVYWPVVLCGDLNTLPLSPLYRFFASGSLPAKGLQCGTLTGLPMGGKKGGRNPLVVDEIVNNEIGVTEESQHLSVEQERNPLLRGRKISSTNVFSHHFNLVSAYRHVTAQGQPEVSTHHTKAKFTVDYVFYSVASKTTRFDKGYPEHSRLEEDQLTHLASLSLMSNQQLRSKGSLPNATQSSDHLPLLTRFLWKLP